MPQSRPYSLDMAAPSRRSRHAAREDRAVDLGDGLQSAHPGGGQGRGRPAGGDVQRDARPARGSVRVPAPVRRRCPARAAHSAHYRARKPGALSPRIRRSAGRSVALLTEELERMSRIVSVLLLLVKREPAGLPRPLDRRDRRPHGRADVESLRARAPSVDRGEPWSGIVVADRQRLTQAVLQLAENAIKHSSEHGPVWLGSSVSEGAARLWVRDAGIGVSEDERDAIFDRFRRVGTALARKFGPRSSPSCWRSPRPTAAEWSSRASSVVGRPSRSDTRGSAGREEFE